MSYWIHAHFDGKNLVPEEPVDLPAGQRLRVQIEPENGAPSLPSPGSADAAGTQEIESRRRKLRAVRSLFPGPTVPLEALRRENLYDRPV